MVTKNNHHHSSGEGMKGKPRSPPLGAAATNDQRANAGEEATQKIPKER